MSNKLLDIKPKIDLFRTILTTYNNITVFINYFFKSTHYLGSIIFSLSKYVIS